MSEEGKALYAKRKLAIIANRFDGDEAAYQAWLTDHMRKIAHQGGKNSTHRPFKNKDFASYAGKQRRNKHVVDDKGNTE